jgi:hypothetical protein
MAAALQTGDTSICVRRTGITQRCPPSPTSGRTTWMEERARVEERARWDAAAWLPHSKLATRPFVHAERVSRSDAHRLRHRGGRRGWRSGHGGMQQHGCRTPNWRHVHLCTQNGYHAAMPTVSNIKADDVGGGAGTVGCGSMAAALQTGDTSICVRRTGITQRCPPSPTSRRTTWMEERARWDAASMFRQAMMPFKVQRP